MSQDVRRTWIQRRYAAFDGMRGLAVFLVFLAHYGTLVMPHWMAACFWPGVDLFFVLSGFLITGILYDSRNERQYYRTFYVRRALRIFPLYYGAFFLLFILRRHFLYDKVVWLFLLYVANFAWIKLPGMNPTVMILRSHHEVWVWLGALWSLCVEEQFYLVWPFLLRALGTRRRGMHFCAGAIVFTLALRCFLYARNPALVAGTHYLYFATYARCDSLFIGAFLALWLRGRQLRPSELLRRAHLLIAAPGLLAIALAATVGRHWPNGDSNPVFCTVGYTLVGLVAGGVLLAALYEGSAVHKLFRIRLLSRMGVVSYGFYLIHGLVLPEFLLLHARTAFVPLNGPLTALLALVLVYGAAWVSFRFYESPFLKLKGLLAPASHLSVPSGTEEQGYSPADVVKSAA